MTDLDKLIEAVEAAEDDLDILEALHPSDKMFGHAWRYVYVIDAYRGSLDAALAIHEALLPNEGWHVEWLEKYPNLALKPAAWFASVGWGTRYSAYADNPARAWLIAILKAYRAQQ